MADTPSDKLKANVERDWSDQFKVGGAAKPAAPEPAKPAEPVPPVVSGGDAGKMRRAARYMAEDWRQTREIFPQRVESAKDAARWVGGKGYAVGAAIVNHGFPRAEMLLVIFGMAKFFLEYGGFIQPTGATAILFSTLLLFFTAIFVLDGEGSVLALVIIIYLNWFGFPFDPSFLRIGVPLVVFGAYLFGVRSVIGPRLLPAGLIYFYDIGVFHKLVSSFGYIVPEMMSSYITTIPWWMVLGLSYIDIEQYKNKGFATLMKIVGIGIIIATILGTSLPGIGFAQTPLIQEFQDARAQVEGQLPKGEHPLISQAACVLSEYQNIDACVKRRQAESKCAYLEKTDLEAHAECMAVARGEKNDARVVGAIDEAQREPTAFTISKGERYLDSIENDEPVPFILDVKNPRSLRLEFDITCTYEAGKQKIEGLPIHYSVAEELTQQFAFVCRAAQELPSGVGKWVVKVTARGLTTTVGLHRFFVGDKKNLVENIAQTFFSAPFVQASTSTAAQPRGPPDPVRLDFIVGQPPQNPILETADPQLIATIKNNAGGELLSISRAEIAMDAQQFTPGPECKLQQQGDTFVHPSLTLGGKEKLREFRFALCDLVMSDTYRFPELPIHRYFMSTITYDYRITKEFTMTVYQPVVAGVTAASGGLT